MISNFFKINNHIKNIKIRFDPQILGGESILLDAFEVAEEFREKYPKYFQGNLIMSNTKNKLNM